MEAPIEVFGCLPAIVHIEAGRDWDGEDWVSIEHIWWRKRDGSKGKEFSKQLFDRAIEEDQYNIEESAWDWWHENHPPKPEINYDLVFDEVSAQYPNIIKRLSE
jgi:hypothetical protein